ncbi:hypothetical protein SVA_1326 [Sulfurifustis variabilis]|uniref:Uncharacterized protein n=1 Tax=Sulfurifustis variabilis TaxID=1675686 RepID=A0A1B4V8X0_9GAMM|nr:hypothetical protein [Sulfurifustis variabilis]BAU47894.1 hypothetical protein SVA_1326 [Sulfurifustis variabilis]
MPYFVFRFGPDRKPVLVDTFEKYKDAKDACRNLRRQESPDDPNGIRMAFAKTEHDAKRLLAEKREPSSPLEEWEA